MGPQPAKKLNFKVKKEKKRELRMSSEGEQVIWVRRHDDIHIP